MCKTIYALLILIFIFIVLNWLKTRETFSSSCNYSPNKQPDFKFEVIKSYHDKILEDVKAECTRDPSCQYIDYIETKSAANGGSAKGMGVYRKCTKGTEDKSYIKINKIKISIEGADKVLTLTEVKVKDKNSNDLLNKDTAGKSEQSSTYQLETKSNKAYDNNLSTQSHTEIQLNPYWFFTWYDPINFSDIDKIKISIDAGGSDGLKKRINGAKVELLMDSKVIKTFPLKYISGRDVYKFTNDYNIEPSALTQYKKVCDTPKSNSNIFSDGIKRTDSVQREPSQANNMFGAVFNVRQDMSFLSSKLN